MELTAGSPHVWIFDVREPRLDGLADAHIVSDQELARAEKLTNPEAARRLLGRRSVMRILLGRYRGQDPATIRVVTAPGGKPVLLPENGQDPSRAGLTFSVGHSGDLYCVAVGRERSLGVDIEKLREVTRARSIAERWFGAGESERFARVSDEDLGVEFMRMWTAKEALAKRHGAGLRLMRGDDAELDVDAADATNRLRHFSPGDGYAGAVASTEPIEDIEILRPEDDFWTI